MAVPKRVCLLAVAVASLFAVVAVRARAQEPVASAPVAERVQERTLANGLRVLIERDGRQPRVAVVMAYDAGMRDDPSGYRELAHVVEHMTYRGSRHVKPNEGGDRVIAAGGLFNGFTSRDHAAYVSQLPAEQLPLALWLESERMAFTTEAMNDDLLDIELDVVRSEWLERDSEGMRAALPEAQMHELFPEGHPYRHTQDRGSKRDFSYDLEHVRWFHQQHYRPENATLAIVGDIDLAEANALIDKYFAGVRGTGTRAARPAAPVVPFAGERVIDFEWRYPRPGLIVRYRTACPDLVCKQALRMLAERATGDRHSLLSYALQTQAGIASEVSMSLVEYDHAQEVVVYAWLEPQTDLKLAQRVLDDAIAQMVELAVEDKELTSLKQAVWTGELRSAESIQYRATRYATSSRTKGERYDLDALERALFSVTKEQLMQLGAGVLSTRKRLIVRVAFDEDAVQGGKIVDSSGMLFHTGAEASKP